LQNFAELSDFASKVTVREIYFNNEARRVFSLACRLASHES
jgi:hypothetical protein